MCKYMCVLGSGLVLGLGTLEEKNLVLLES